jgi:hypothetical protein
LNLSQDTRFSEVFHRFPQPPPDNCQDSASIRLQLLPPNYSPIITSSLNIP